MGQTAFNLIDERWILATDTQGITKELSLSETFVKAHELRALSGEMPAQDVAVLRLLLGVLYAVYTRTDEYIGAREDEDAGAAREYWKKLWDAGRFEEERITDYLRGYQDRFWLIHPEHPFYQVARLDKGTKFTTGKLIGDLAESSNKAQLFPLYNGEAKKAVTFSAAARWLVYLHSFVDNSGKPAVYGSGVKGGGPGWLGHFGVVWVCGNNLFETLLLNFSLYDRNEKLWEDGQATWELDIPRTEERTEIPIPISQTELLTLQSRRVLLFSENDLVVDYIEMGGDRFAHENAFIELMTAWSYKTGADVYLPRKHDTTKQLWRSVSPLIAETANTRIPGVVKWLVDLEYDGIIQVYKMEVCALCIAYGAQSSGVKEVWADSIALNAALLSRLRENWLTRITKLLEVTEKMVNQTGYLASDLAIATGDRDGKTKRASAREEAYFRLDLPFRSWLAAINPQTDDIEAIADKWVNITRKVVLDLGAEMVSQAGTKAFVGREVEVKNKKYRYTAPEVYNKFRRIVKRIKEE